MCENPQQPRTGPAWLRALGRADLPETIEYADRILARLTVFKHDFFAATGLYGDSKGKAVLKIGRRAGLFGLPLSFIGKYLTDREVRLLSASAGIPGVAGVLATFSRNCLLREYIAGHPLSRNDTPNDEFFPELLRIINSIHARGMAYVDLEKPENILVGDDGRPYLIDFQISWKSDGRLGRVWPFRWFLGVLQQADRYHLYKHWRRLRPDQIDAETEARMSRPPFWIRWHRFFFRPITLLRRQILVWLGARDSVRGRSPG